MVDHGALLPQELVHGLAQAAVADQVGAVGRRRLVAPLDLVLALRAGLDALPSERRAAAAEALAGNMKKHVVYVARFGEAGAPDPAARIARHGEPEAVPILAGIEPRRLAESLNRERLLKAELDGLTLRFPVPPLASALVLRIDGRTSLAAIHAALAAQNPDLDWDRFMAQFDALYAALNGINALWIRNPPVPA